ncbi:MAG: alpha-L-fucosidase [Verrucomicrobia bacterium]|nr:alpha-L-fucosidase [Verrucomicrobiota bacterium]
MRLPRLPRLALLLVAGAAAVAPLVRAAVVQDATAGSLNKPERLEWFRDLGFGLFIHWNVDVQLGTVISHSLVGASEDYQRRYFAELPRLFNPSKFHPADWAALARLAGIRYVVLTAKHHAGFCLWPTQTTDFHVGNTPFRRDITKELLEAFRAQGIAAGLYHSPDDFWWLWKNGIQLQRNIPAVQPSQNPGLLRHDQEQVRELLTHYGPIDVLFFDGEPQGLREVAWQLQPNVVVTRGAIPTPEQNIPGIPLEGAWESCITMGRSWGYQPTHEVYKSGPQCLSLLIETRAKGGNLLLNVGPKPDGELPIEQEERLREIALWMFVNQECIYAVRPWVITNERDIWFTKRKDADTLYAIIKRTEPWPDGAWKEFVLKSVRATPQTEASILGQNDQVMEYQPSVVPKTTFRQEADGLHVRAMHTQRLHDDRRWPNPIVIKLTHVQPAFTPPHVATVKASYDKATHSVRCEGNLLALGDAAALEVGFEYRDITGLDLNDRPDTWTAVPAGTRKDKGTFTATATGLGKGRTYEFRAVARHPLLPLYGRDLRVRVP